MAASEVYPPYPSSTSTKPYTALATVPETITGERDGEHLHHRPRDEPLCLSQVKHKYLVNRCLSGKQDDNVEFAAQCGGNAFQSGY